MKSIPIFILLSILFAFDDSTGPNGGQKDYLIGEGDVLEITVYEEDELNRTLKVSGDGYIIFPLIGKVKVAGMSPIELGEKLRTLLEKDYIVNPNVIVFVKEYGSKEIQVLGSVKEPGVYYLTGHSTVLDLLSRAGGVLPEGGKNLFLIRKHNAGVEEKSGERYLAHVIDLHKLLKEGNLKEDVEVIKGDVLFVPKADEVYIIGEVNEPGNIPYEEGLTLLQAISKTGGFTKNALMSKVQIIRMKGNSEEKIRVNVKKIKSGEEKDFTLMPEDIIIVPESIF